MVSAKAIMTDDVIVVKRQTPIRQAIQILVDNEITGLPVVNDDMTVSSVEKEIRGIRSDILEDVTLFDIYKGKPIAKDKKSLAFSIRYRSLEKTLTDKEVDEVHAAILKRLKDNLRVELRS